MKYWVSKEFAERMVNVAHNLHNIGTEQHGGRIFLVNYRDVPLTPMTAEVLAVEIEELKSEIVDLTGHPKEYLDAKLTSFEYLLRFIEGEEFDYAVLLDKIQQLPCEEISKEVIENLKTTSTEFLKSLGLKGSLQEMKETWYEANYLEADEVLDFARKYIDALKEVTLERVAGLHADDEIDAINGTTGVYWSGFSAYPGDYKGNLTFNIEKKWNKYEFIHVLAHEGYPGHQTFYSRWDMLLENDQFPMEAAYYLLNEPINTLFEGGPENAIAFIGWNDPERNAVMTPEEVHALNGVRELMKLTRVFQTNAGYFYNTGKMDREECIAYMMNEGMMNRLDAENTFRFFSAKLSCTTYPSYYYGRKYVEDTFNSVPVEKRKEYFRILYDEPHTNVTFMKAIKNLLES
jgi:hypothetical protein